MKKITKRFYNDGLIVEYSNPRIQPFNEGYFDNITEKDIMYFYYDLNIYLYDKIDMKGNVILAKKRTLLSTNAYDFPKVQYVPETIDYLINEPCTLVLEDYKSNEFHRVQKYNQIELRDIGEEYFYRFERNDYYVTQDENNEPFEHTTYYSIFIGKGHKRKEYGNMVYIDNLSKEQLLQFKKVAQDFLKSAIEEENFRITEQKLKCPNCEKIFKAQGNNIHDEYNDWIFKCPNCNTIINEEELDNFWEEIYIEE